jgi:hypothetical protein
MIEPTEYEKFVKQVIEEISDGSIHVYHQRAYIGKRSGRTIVIDVSFEMEVLGGARLLVLIECKRYSDKVKVDDVEEFYSKLDDIGAHKGIMFTTVGYQDGALKTARGRGIGLALLTDKPQKGELKFIVNAVSSTPQHYCSNKLLQGNFKPLDDFWKGDHEAGFRFESFGQLLSVLYLSVADRSKGKARIDG